MNSLSLYIYIYKYIPLALLYPSDFTFFLTILSPFILRLLLIPLYNECVCVPAFINYPSHTHHGLALILSHAFSHCFLLLPSQFSLHPTLPTTTVPYLPLPSTLQPPHLPLPLLVPSLSPMLATIVAKCVPFISL